MSYSSYINNETLNTSVREILKPFKNGVNRNDFAKIIHDSLGRFIPSSCVNNGNLNSIFSKLDANKDNKITEKEVSTYLAKNYNISLDKLYRNNAKVKSVVDTIEKKDDEAKGKGNNQASSFKGIWNSIVGIFFNKETAKQYIDAANSGSIGQMNAAYMSDVRNHYFQP